MRTSQPHRSDRRTRAARPSLGTVLAGWRLVRPLPDAQGRSQFVAVSVDRSPRQAASAHWDGFTAAVEVGEITQRRLVAVPSGQAAAGLLRECTVREALASEFVAEAVEAVTDGEWCIAVFPFAHRTSYAEYVARGVRLDATAVVTMLVPVAEVLARAHEVGFAHGSLTLATCTVDAVGKPCVEGWAELVELEGIARVRADLARAADQRALGRMAQTLLGCTRTPVTAPLTEIVDRLSEGAAGRDGIAECIAALFRWSPAGAIPPLGMAASGRVDADRTNSGRGDGVGVAQAAVLAELEVPTGDDEPLLTPMRAAPERDGGVGKVASSERHGSGARGGNTRFDTGWLAVVHERARRLASGVRPRIWLLTAVTGAFMTALGALVQVGVL